MVLSLLLGHTHFPCAKCWNSIFHWPVGTLETSPGPVKANPLGRAGIMNLGVFNEYQDRGL